MRLHLRQTWEHRNAMVASSSVAKHNIVMSSSEGSFLARWRGWMDEAQEWVDFRVPVDLGERRPERERVGEEMGAFGLVPDQFISLTFIKYNIP